MSLVTESLPLIVWIRQLFAAAPLESGQMGFRVSLAEMHRIYMRALQIELVKMGVALQFGDDDQGASIQKKARLETARKYALQNLEPALEKYSTENELPSIRELTCENSSGSSRLRVHDDQLKSTRLLHCIFGTFL